jgi:hypothetical protein
MVIVLMLTSLTIISFFFAIALIILTQHWALRPQIYEELLKVMRF